MKVVGYTNESVLRSRKCQYADVKGRAGDFGWLFRGLVDNDIKFRIVNCWTPGLVLMLDCHSMTK
nr:AIF_HP1_G0030770.mRNA.1.CDS.1 [Saccharomyces cerevisiae]